MSDSEEPGLLRRESETEVLDDSQAARGPLPGLSALAGMSRLRDSARFRSFRRVLNVTSVLAVAAAAATFSGVLTHGSDVRGSALPDPDTAVVHLVGGGETLDLDQNTYIPGAAAGQLRFTVRNDGPLPIDILSATVTDPGVTVTQIDRDMPAAPGEQIMIIIAVTVDCSYAAVAERPAALHLSVHTANGHLHQVALAVPPGRQPFDERQLADVSLEGSALGDYHVLCGEVANHVTPSVHYEGMQTAATPANPTFGYRVTVTNSSAASTAAGNSAKVVAPTGTTLPGVVTTTDLPWPQPLSFNEQITVGVDFRITDCAALGYYMDGFAGPDEGGIGFITAANVAGDGVLTINQADRRFPSAPQAIRLNSNDFYIDFARQLVAACPTLR